ncbi:MAG TPA: MFS transporter [Chroococcidiopsis sp.]
MKVFKTLTASCRHNLLILFLAGLLFWSALASLLPTLPLYVSEIGGNSQDIGIVMGCFAIGLLLFRSWLARLADLRGRKLVLIIGMVAVAFAPLGYLATHSIPLLMAVRAIHGISIAAFALAYSALVVDVSPPESRGELIGYMSLVNPTGMALGPALGGFLHEWGGYTPAFWAAAVMGMVGLVCTMQVRESGEHLTRKASDQQSAGQFWLMLGSPRIRIPAVVLFLIGLAFGGLTTFVPLLFKQVQVDLNVGLFYTAAAIASFGIRLITGRASDQYGRGPFITVSLVMYMGSMVFLWQATNASTFLLAGVLEGAGGGILIPMMAALMADRSYPDERGRTFSLCMVGFDLGIAVAGPCLGAIADATDYRFIFGLAAGLAFLGLVVFMTLSSKDLLHSMRFATGQGEDVYAVDIPHLKPQL